MTTPTPDLAELRRLYSEWQETVKPYGFLLMPSGEYYALAAAAVDALPDLLDAAAERDALADRLAAAEVASRGYRERADRAEETMLLAVKRADTLAATVAAVRALALNQSGPGRWARDEGWAAFVPAVELLAALDKEPQP